MSWTESDKHCYPSGIETPYWIIGIGFVTSLFINSFILFSGESLTSKLWNRVTSCLYKYLCCCRSSTNSQSETYKSKDYLSMCTICCKKQRQKSMKYPSILKVSISKNIHRHNSIDDTYESESDEEDSLRVHKSTTIDISIKEIMFDNDEDHVQDDVSHEKYDVSLTASQISGYYKLIPKDKYKDYKHPLYESTHATLTGDHLLLYYLGDYNDVNEYVGWCICYSSFYGFRNELFQSVIKEHRNHNNIIHNHKDLLLNINNNYTEEPNDDDIKYIHLKLRSNNGNCVWKLCQLDSYEYMNGNESNIVGYDNFHKRLKVKSNECFIKNAVKLQINNFSEITNNFMNNININGNYYLLNDDQTNNNIQIKENSDNLSIDSNQFPKIEINQTHENKEEHYHHSVTSNHSLSSLLSSTNSRHRRKHRKLLRKKVIIVFQHESNEDLQFFYVNKSMVSKRHKHHGRHLSNEVQAAVFHNRLQHFIAYVPSDNNISDGNNWKLIQWNWKTINNLTISSSTACLSYYFAQILSVCILIIGAYQWYIDVMSFIKYYKQYNNKYSLWRQYECYAFIVTNTPNMKQLILMIGLIIWSYRISTKSNYHIYLQKQTVFQIILLMGYLCLIFFSIPVLFTHFLPIFIPFGVVMALLPIIAHKCCSTHSKDDLKKEMNRRHKAVTEKFKRMNDVTDTENLYGIDFQLMFGNVLLKFACMYFVLIFCVPVMSRVYDGMNIVEAFLQTYNQRKTIIYFENIRMGYEIDLDRLRLLMYWLF